MKKRLWVLSVLGAVVFCESFRLVDITDDVYAAEPVITSQRTDDVNLSNVQPGDWAFTALRRLIAEYGCLDSYAAWLFRGDRAITRYEFARGINVCLDVVIQTINQKDDFDTIRRLQEEFAAELSVLRG